MTNRPLYMSQSGLAGRESFRHQEGQSTDFRVSSFGSLPSTTGVLARLAYAQARAADVLLEPLLKASGLTVQQMEAQSVRIPVRSEIKFLNVVANAQEDEFLGFHLAQQLDLREIGLLHYVVASSESLIDALQRLARFGSITNEGRAISCADGSDVRVLFRHIGVSRHLDRHEIEGWMTALLRSCRQLTGLRLLPSYVRLIHLREYCSAEFSRFFGTDIEFGAPVDEIVFAKKTRNLPVVSADPFLNKLLIKYCEEALSHRQSSRESFRSRVENTVVPLLPHGKARGGEIARRLGVSQRTFDRRLSSEGLTFTGLLESLRLDLAKRYLAEETLTISKLAWLLGYQDVSSFSHAFKRWTGTTPREFRAAPVIQPLN
jgi:AraC-like DNA-binding protein